MDKIIHRLLYENTAVSNTAMSDRYQHVVGFWTQILVIIRNQVLAIVRLEVLIVAYIVMFTVFALIIVELTESDS